MERNVKTRLILKLVKINTKIIIVAILLQIVVLIAVATVVYTGSAHTIEAKTQEQMIILKNRLFHSLQNKIDRAKRDAEVITEMLKNSYEPTEILKEASRRFTLYRNIIVTDKDANIIDMAPYEENYYRRNVRHAIYWQKTKKTNEVYVSDIGSTLFGYPGIAISSPISFDYGLGEVGFVGVLVLFINKDNLFSSLNYPTIGEYGLSYAVSKKGELLTSPEDLLEKHGYKIPAKQLSLLAEGSAASKERLRRANLGGEDYLYTADAFGEGDLHCTLVSLMPRDVVLKETHLIRDKVVLILLSSILITAVLMFVALRQVLSPLSKLVDACEDIGRGNWDTKVDIHAGHDVAVLGNSFNKMTAELKKTTKKVAQYTSQAAMGRIAAHIAHDMRSPLSVLRSYVGLPKDVADEEAEEYKGAAIRSVKKLLRMADDLVDYAKAMKIERSTVTLDELVDGSALLEAKNDISKSCATIRQEAKHGVLVTVDAHKIGRVLVNLVSNAIQSISHSLGEVVVKAEVERNRNLVLSVIDNGKGIESEHLPHIFDTLYTIGKRGGTGLGLSYCRQVIEAHGGTIGVQSIVGKGTTFTIRIPDCVVCNNERQMGQVETVSEKGSVVSRQVLKKLLIVDDDEDVRSQWQHIVDKNGGRIVCLAASAEEVQKSEGIDYSKINTAIVDYRYEGCQLTGIDLIAFLKRKGVKEIHLCTGYYYEKDICRRAAEAGADSVIPKPIDDNSVSRLFS